MGDASNHPVWVRGLSAVALTLPCHVNHVHGPTAYRVIAPATLQTGGQTENADKQSVQLLNHSVTQSLSESTSAPTDISDSSCATLYHGRTANPRLVLHKTTPSIAGSDSRDLESACWLIGGGGTRKGRLHLSHPAWVPQGTQPRRFDSDFDSGLF
jgi:hypothetical protein